LKSALGGHIVYGLDERIIYAADYQSDIGGCIDHGLEEIIKHAVEEFSGQSFKKFEHLRLRDSEGELYGSPADVEYDLYLEDHEGCDNRIFHITEIIARRSIWSMGCRSTGLNHRKQEMYRHYRVGFIEFDR